MSSIELFSVKDKVFVRRRGYPAWPAIITDIKTNTQSQPIYTVYFYGTGNYNECDSQVLISYEANKYKLGKPRGKNKKFKKLVEAFLQIENDVKTSFLPNNNNTKVFRPLISTSTINQELPLEQISKNMSEIEIQSKCNLKSEDNSINELNLSKVQKGVLRKRAPYFSTGLKRKLSDVKHTEVQNKLIKTKISKPKEVQHSMDTLLKSQPVGKQNSETADIDVAPSEQIFETLNTTKSVLESSDISSNQCKTAESISTNDSIATSSNMFSNSDRISRFGRKIKPGRLSDQKFVSTVTKNVKKQNSKSLKTHNSGDNEKDDSLKPIVKSEDSSTKTKNTLESDVTIIPSSSQKIYQVNHSRQESNQPIKNIMDSSSNVEAKWDKLESEKVEINLLEIEVNLLNLVHDLTKALSIGYKEINYELALKSLEQIMELQFNALMLTKHRHIVDNITKVSKYVGDVNNWCLNNQEAIEHAAKAKQIRYKAYLVLQKCASLFTILDGQTFHEVYNKKFDEFFAKTRHWNNMQIYGCTSEKILE